MIQAEHIINIKIDIERLTHYFSMPPPSYVRRHTDSQLAAIGNAVIGSIMRVDPTVFEMQLSAARDFGVSYLYQDANNRVVGISPAVSLIKDDQILSKNLIVPRRWLMQHPSLTRHMIVGIFIKGRIDDGNLITEAINLAGWTDTRKLREQGRSNDQLPGAFQSKIAIVALPCKSLDPITSLIEDVESRNLCV
jgi:hypothetical protein